MLLTILAIRCFNPRTYERCDASYIEYCIRGMRFQSTHLREVRLSTRFSSCRLFVSIHAPTRGATKYTEHYKNFMRVSIHAPTRGATGRPQTDPQRQCVSIHAPTRGATRYYVHCTAYCSVSIHAPTRGATQSCAFLACCRSVSIHAPTRGATFVSAQIRSNQRLIR